jgi:RHS repeat-associated protein
MESTMAASISSRFTGAYADPVVHGYPLGHGYRWFLPSLMRFTVADAASPFDEGGVNPYTYCGGDPIDRVDPSGHTWALGWASGLDDEALAAAKAKRVPLALRGGILKAAREAPWEENSRPPTAGRGIRFKAAEGPATTTAQWKVPAKEGVTHSAYHSSPESPADYLEEAEADLLTTETHVEFLRREAVAAASAKVDDIDRITKAWNSAMSRAKQALDRAEGTLLIVQSRLMAMSEDGEDILALSQEHGRLEQHAAALRQDFGGLRPISSGPMIRTDFPARQRLLKRRGIGPAAP